MKWLRLVFVAAVASLLVTGCGGCGEVAGAGESCDPDVEQPCEDADHELVCIDDEDGDHRCLHPVGGSCDGDADQNLCPPDTSCSEDGDGDSRCLVEESAECDPDDDHCADGLACEEIDGDDEEYQCHPEISVRGYVFDMETEEAIEGAHVVAFDEERSALSDVAVTDEDGIYEMTVPALRDEDGEPDQVFTLRVDAQDYQTFPSGLRQAQPIDAGNYEEEDGRWVIDTAQTDVGLLELPEGERGYPAISGRVDIEGGLSSVLVVAEPQGVDFEGEEDALGFSAVTGLDGSFTIFNVPPDDYDVRGYRAGYQIEPEQVAMDDEEVDDVVLVRADESTTDVIGSIQIVRGEGETSVMLMTAATFDEFLVRGEVPKGLVAEGIDGGWQIDDVPAGQYVVMAGFENDGIVRSPDEGMAGTDIVYIEVPAGDEELDTGESFKATPALPTIGPGEDRPEALSEPPTLEWTSGSHSNSDWYDIQVFDAFGNIVFEEEEFEHFGGSGQEFDLEYDGEFEEGMYYQFRVTAFRESGGSATPVSSTEFLRGVFYHEP